MKSEAMKTEAIGKMSTSTKIYQTISKTPIFKVYLIMLLLYVASGILEPNYFAYDHMMQLLVMASFLGILAIGQTLVILTGGIDLSVAYALNLGAVMVTQLAVEQGSAIAIISVVAVGLFIGICNGLGVAYLNIHPLVMTLAMGSILKSAVFVYTNGTPKGEAPAWLRYIANESFLGVKLAVFVWLILSIFVFILLRKTTFGRKVFAIGNSTTVAQLSGIKNKRVTITVYALSSLFAVFAGLMLTGYSGQSYLGMGDMYLLPSIAAVVIGGTSILGGRGGYIGTIAGAIIIYILMSILTILDLKDAGRQIIYGLVILSVLIMYGRGKILRT